MKIVSSILFACAIALPTVTLAGGSSGTQMIGKIVVPLGIYANNAANTTAIKVYGTDGAWNNPDACDRSALVLVSRDFLSSLLKLKSEQTPVTFHLRECQELLGITYPIAVFLTVD